MAFTRMDSASAEDWAALRSAVGRWQGALSGRIEAMLLRLAEQRDGMAIDQLQHSLQTATRARRAGASDELIVGALCHDLGTAISCDNHAAIAAEILRPFVSREVYEIVRTHQEFNQAYYQEGFGKNVVARQRYAREPWFRAAERFSDEWDRASFDPAYETLSLDDFVPLLNEIFAKPRPAFYAPPASRARPPALMARCLEPIQRMLSQNIFLRNRGKTKV